MAVSRADLGMRYTTIAGYAGSGKSTLVQYIVQALGCNEDNTGYIAYTGKVRKSFPSLMCIDKRIISLSCACRIISSKKT